MDKLCFDLDSDFSFILVERHHKLEEMLQSCFEVLFTLIFLFGVVGLMYLFWQTAFGKIYLSLAAAFVTFVCIWFKRNEHKIPFATNG